MKRFVMLLFCLVAVVGLTAAPVYAQWTKHTVQILDDQDQPMVGLDVTIWIQTGPDFNDPLDWTEYNQVTDGTGTVSASDFPHGNADSWEYEVIDVGPPNGYTGVDPTQDFVIYNTVSVLLDHY